MKLQTKLSKAKSKAKLLTERNENLMAAVQTFRQQVRYGVRKERELLQYRILKLKGYRSMLKDRYGWGFFRRVRFLFSGK